MTWFTFALLAGACFAASRIVSRIALRHEGNPLAFTAITDFLAGFALLPFAVGAFSFPADPFWWIAFGGIVVFAFLSDWLAFASLRRIPASEYQLLNQSRHLFVLFGGLIFFSEAVTLAKLLGLTLIAAGVVLAVYERGRFAFNRGAVFALLSTLAAVTAFLFAKHTVADTSPLAVASLELVIIGALSFPFLKFRVQPIVTELRRAPVGLVTAGLVFGGFEGFLFLALESGEASRVIPVTQIALPITVLVGIFLLRERSRLTQKIAGMALAVIGIFALYVV